MTPDATVHRARRLARALFGSLCAAAGIAAQTTVTIACDRDNSLYESASGTLSNGKGMGVFAGLTGQPLLRRGLLHFDVAANVPAGARIISAQLNLSVSRAAVGANFDVRMHRVLSNWGEGNSNASGEEGRGATATTNDATWRHAFYPSTFWTNVGGDFAPTISAVMSTPPFGPVSSPNATGAIADVQSWLDQPTQNFGWLLKTSEQTAYVAYRYDSRESPNVAARPTLTVTWLLPGQPAATIGTGCPGNGGPFTSALQGAPLGGATVALTQTNGPPGGLAANLLALAWEPAGAPLLPQCSFWLPLGGELVTQSLVVLDASGAASTPYPLPFGFAGTLLAGQSAALDASPDGYVLSNAWLAVLN